MEGTYQEDWIYYEVSNSAGIKELISDIRNRKAIALSDGSYKKEWKKGQQHGDSNQKKGINIYKEQQFH